MTWGNPETTQEKLLSNLLWPVSAGFGLGLYARMMAYNWQVLRQHRAEVPVISIGNVTVGGTGKTPVTIDLARRLTEMGHRVGVLSRGYKRLSKDPILVVSNGRGEIATCGEAGDEPYLIAKSVPQAVVIVGSKRVQTAPLAVKRYGCDVILLDDGFQHFPIARNSDVVLIDYNDDLSKDRLLPAGRLREPLSALARADWVIVTKVPPSPDLDKLYAIRSLIAQYAPRAHVSSCRMVPHMVQTLESPDVVLDIASLKGTKVFAFSGIARPAAFNEQLTELGAQVVGTRSFGDHHWYTHDDMAELRFEFERAGADLIVTTEKDAVKVSPGMAKGLPVAVLKQGLEWLGPLPLPSERMLAGSPDVVAAIGTKS